MLSLFLASRLMSMEFSAAVIKLMLIRHIHQIILCSELIQIVEIFYYVLCYEAIKGEEYTFSLLVNETGEIGTFDLTCTICNAYPILSEWLDDDNLEMSSIEWLNETDSYGRSLFLTVLALIAYLS